MTTEAMQFVGGPFAGDIRAVNDTTMSITLPITGRNGNTLLPPRWAQYVRDGEYMVWIGDFGTVEDAIAATIVRHHSKMETTPPTREGEDR